MQSIQIDAAPEALSEPKPPCMDLSHHLTSWAKAREPSKIKEFYKYFAIPGMSNLAGGLPFNQYFPFDTLEAKVATSSRFAEDLNNQFLSLLRSSRSDTSHIDIPKFASPKTAPQEKLDVATALQYGTSEGFMPLRNFIQDFAMNYQHGGKIPYENAGILLTCGNTDGLYKAMSLIADGSRGDKMLCEKYCYMNAPQTVKPYGIEVVPVEVDEQGMTPDGPGGLRELLDNWDVVRRGKRPNFMYTIPIGQNPTSGNLSIPRRKEIYEICQKYDIIIVEDDPYWYLQFDKEKTGLTAKEFLPSLIPSYVTIDIDGRVIRLDTFSKTVAPGTRLGWITANPIFIERLIRATDTSTAQPSGVVQAMIAELLLNNWGMDGWISWLSLLRDKYKVRAELMYDILLKDTHTEMIVESPAELDMRRIRYVRSSSSSSRKALKSAPVPDELSNNYSLVNHKNQELYSMVRPAGGMFVWVHINIKDHPRYDGHNALKLMLDLWKWLASSEVLVLAAPGTMFSPTQGIAEGEGCEYLRLAFTAVDEDELQEASKRFGPAVKRFFLEDIHPDAVL